MAPVFAGEGNRFVMKEKRDVFVEFAVVGRGGSADASMEGRKAEEEALWMKLSDCDVCVRGKLGCWLAFRLRIWSS